MLTLGVKPYIQFDIRFTWDDAKRQTNAAKHGVDFLAVSAFDFSSALVSASQSANEPRLVAIGLIGQRVHVLVYSIERRTVRVISLRKANRREVTFYASQF